MRSCYLCGRKATKVEKVSLHKFPKIPQIRQKWIEACGLHHQDVSHLYICSYHFELSQKIIALKKLPPGAVPNINVTNAAINKTNSPEILNHPLELSNISNNNELIIDSTNISKLPEIKIRSSSTSYVIDDHDYAVQPISKTPAFHSLPIIESTNMSKSPNVKIISSTISDVIDADYKVQPMKAYSYSEKNFSSPKKGLFAEPRHISEVTISSVISSPKKRFFAEPRYISEITISDVSTPRKAKRIIDFIKKIDQKKCKQIKCLQNQNRKLLKRILTLQNFISHLEQSKD